MAKRSDTSVARVRNGIIAFVALVAILVIGYGTLYSTGVGTPDEFVAGDHYRVVENPTRRRAGEPVHVIEYFSYLCGICRNFDPLVEDWQRSIPEGVAFSRSHVQYTPIMSLLSQSYIALESLDILEQNHTRIFRAIHDANRQFLSADMMADFIDGHGATTEEFLATFNSASVRRSVRDAAKTQRDLVVSGVPTLIVDNKYVVNMDYGRKLALDITDHVINLAMSAE